MVETHSCPSNTHIKCVSLSASMVIIIITRHHPASRLITQYFNHLLLYSLPLATQNWWAIINYPTIRFIGWNIQKLIWMPGSWLFACISSDSLQVGERPKLCKENKDAIKINEYLAWYYTIIDFNEVDIRIYLPEKEIIHRSRYRLPQWK